MKRITLIMTLLAALALPAFAQKTVKLGHGSSMALYLPEEPNGQMVVICPGGGYETVCTEHEGVMPAQWLNARGISAAVVTYALPQGHPELPLLCVQDALRWCRKNASRMGVTSVGVMGFSAGGHLAATAETHWIDEVTRPDFAVLVYPVITMVKEYTHAGSRNNLIGDDESWKDDPEGKQLTEAFYSIENCVTETTPPTFIVHCSDDDVVPIENSIRMYDALCDFGVPAELHVFPQGGHGFGFCEVGSENDRFEYRTEFLDLLAGWLDSLEK